MAKRSLEDLDLLDDFLFGTMVTYPEIGERFSRILLRIIFQKEFAKLKVIPQKIYYGSDTDKHGTRLDVYLEEELSEELVQNAAIYDIEPDKRDDNKAITALPRRVRFYHAKIDADSLKSGESYHNLKNVIVVMILPFDPFGLNRMVYTVQNCCMEEPAMPYDDGAKTLFLYTKGTEGNPPQALQQLLHYMEHTTDRNASNADLKEIQQMVRTVKKDREVSLGYMKIFEREEMLINQGRQEESVHTEFERKRAEAAEGRAHAAEKRASVAEKNVRRLQEELRRLKQNRQ